jgi:polysaccharide export outer membrane protein
MIEGIRDLDQARVRIGAAMTQKLGQSDVVLSVTVQSWRPVIVGGAVFRPGEVPFRNHLSLIEAVSLAGGPGGATQIGDLSQRIQINQEKERLLQAELRLGRAIARQTRLIAELDGVVFQSLPETVASMVGATQAAILQQRERDLGRLRADTRAVTVRRIEAAQRVGGEDVEAQQAIADSLSRQLVLVRENLAKLEPLFVNGTLSGARILELRRDFVDIEGRVGEARARLAQTLTNQSVLSEEQSAYDIQVRLETVNELIQTQFEILEAENVIETLSATLQSAGESGVSGGVRPGDCRAVILRRGGPSGPRVIAADARSPLSPGDFVQIGRVTRDCPDFLVLSAEVSP